MDAGFGRGSDGSIHGGDVIEARLPHLGPMLGIRTHLDRYDEPLTPEQLASAHASPMDPLVDQTGFEGVDAGTITDSWRQQPGSPVYCTDLTAEEMPGALAKAIAARSPKRRDLAMHVIAELTGDSTSELGKDFLVRVNRLLYV